uniref:Ribonuclease A-domain domain-containing protein n=1 Tax=Neogobius melanostomus TaxID=47308 RepID=A0A8C6U564_9GOBI
MNAPLLCLVLASLLLAPACCDWPAVPPEFWSFDYNHSNGFTFQAFNCTTDMNRKQKDSTSCKPSSIIILGDTWDITPSWDIIKICQGEGTPTGGDLFTSNKSFRVGKCQLQNQGAVPPNCIYKAKITTSQITVACKQEYPVHLEGSE